MPQSKTAQGPAPPRAESSGGGPFSLELLVAAAAIGFGRSMLAARTSSIGRERVPRRDALARRRSRVADAPSEISTAGWKSIFGRLWRGVQDNRVLLVAAGVTFYGLLALFPATAAVVSLYGMFTDPGGINGQVELVSGFLPEGAIHIVGDQIRRIAAQSNATLSLAFAGTLLMSLWGANAGTKAVFDALNIIYGETEKRSFIRLTFQSLLFTLSGIGLIVLAIVSVVAVPITLKLLGIPDESGAALLTLLRWPVLYLVILFALACLYRYGPSRVHPKWRWVTWGSAVSATLWLGGSLVLSWYVANFGTYNATYGSLGAVIGFMIWMWLSTIVVLIGGEINAEMERQAIQDAGAQRSAQRPQSA